MLLIVNTDHEATRDGEQHIEVDLTDRFIAFKKLANKKHDELQSLFTEWNKTQEDIIALAGEISGPERISTNEKEYEQYPDLDKVRSQSQIKFDKAEEAFQETLEAMADFEQRMKELTAETKETMRRQQQVSPHISLCGSY